MAGADFSTGKSIIVLAIVVGCFAILWPKIFYPMMQAAFSMTSPKIDEEMTFRPRDRPPHISPEMMASSPHKTPKPEKPYMKEGRPFPHPSSRQPVKTQAKTGGAMNIIMPIYTIGIVVFFLYTVLKLAFKKNQDEDKKPLVKDFHMDPDYHKFVCQQTTKEKSKSNSKSKDKTPPVISEEEEEKKVFTHNNGSFDEKDYEIYKLRKKLEETESAMERIMKHMGAVSECLSNACILKDCSASGGGNKNITLETLLPESLMEPFKKKLSKNPDKIEKQEENDKSNLSDDNKNEDSSCEDACKEEDKIKKELKRDSSVNSDNSSFELLSQSLLNNADPNSSDSETDNSKECVNDTEEESEECTDEDEDSDDPPGETDVKARQQSK